MDHEHTSRTPEDYGADQALRDARTRFVAGFTQRLGAMTTLLDHIHHGNPDSLAPLRDAAHKMAGLAGVLGFPSVSEHSSSVEVALLQPALDFEAVRAAINRMGAGFARDLSGTAPSWASEGTRPALAARILLVEDDQEQRRVAAAGLRSAGYRVVTAESGPEALQTALVERPDVILLDVDLPEMDGMAVCRQLKLTPALAAVPVIFCTARSGLMDRMAGLTLGADDYITKPFAPSELLLRIRRLVSRAALVPPAGAVVSGLLPYDMFVTAARAALAGGGQASLVLVRVPPHELERLTSRLMDDLRRRDILGRYSDSHLVLLAPGQSMATARAAAQGVIDRFTPKIDGVSVGAADSAAGVTGAGALEALVTQADLSLAEDRVSRSGDQSGRTTILVAEDDPDVLHIVDARLRAAGYRTVLALDGQSTLDALHRESPALVLLDLMMPKLTGFDVLMRLRERPTNRPRTIVVSARGRDEDIARAFELGADDYLTKPFNPEELVARIARLTR